MISHQSSHFVWGSPRSPVLESRSPSHEHIEIFSVFVEGHFHQDFRTFNTYNTEHMEVSYKSGSSGDIQIYLLSETHRNWEDDANGGPIIALKSTKQLQDSPKHTVVGCIRVPMLSPARCC